MREAGREAIGSGWAAAVPLLCAAHCVASPLVVLAAPALALPEAGEAVVKAVSLLLAAALVLGGLRVHRRAAVLLPLAAGAALWLAVPHGPAEWVGSAAGGVLVAAAMVWSAQLRHRATCRACGCAAHRG